MNKQTSQVQETIAEELINMQLGRELMKKNKIINKNNKSQKRAEGQLLKDMNSKHTGAKLEGKKKQEWKQRSRGKLSSCLYYFDLFNFCYYLLQCILSVAYVCPGKICFSFLYQQSKSMHYMYIYHFTYMRVWATITPEKHAEKYM